MAEPIGGNKALAAPVTMTVAASASYASGQISYIDDNEAAWVTTSNILVDGRVYDFETFTTSYVGWDTSPVIFVIDLTEARSGSWQIQGFVGTDAIVRPTRLQVEYSDNGTDWTVLQDRTGLTAGGLGGRGWVASTDASAESHRYWRFTFTNPGTWLFISDVRLV